MRLWHCGARHIKKTGRHCHHYRCTHKNTPGYKPGRCSDRSFILEENFAGQVKRNTQLALIPNEWKAKFLARIATWEAEGLQEKPTCLDRLKAELTSLKAKMDRINTGFNDGSLGIAEFKELKRRQTPI